MTTLDDISATVVTSASYDPKSATKLLNKLIMDFADYHQANPTGNDYTTVSKDTRDTGFDHATLDSTFEEWKDPHSADKNFVMTKALIEVKE